MKVSIITATYNSASSIKTAIDSVLSQTYKDIEHLIIDGASSDDTVALVEAYNDPRIQVISAPDKGIYDALNKGVVAATGEIIGFVHSDDLLAAPTVLEEVVTQIKNGADGVYGDLLYVEKENTNKVVRYWKSRPFYKKLLSRGWMPAHPTLYLKKEVYKKHGHFSLDYHIAADYDLMLRIFSDENLEFTYFPSVITKMRVGGASNRSIKSLIVKSKEDYKVLRKNKVNFPVKVLAYKNLSKISQFIKKQ
ncbi:MAG TPA: glycosyltransferase [Leeuwenhoekiella sp.]|nr:glycosyltransferase [Leeuwenhoekiella sp.]